jgi:hypothetical protein
VPGDKRAASGFGVEFDLRACERVLHTASAGVAAQRQSGEPGDREQGDPFRTDVDSVAGSHPSEQVRPYAAPRWPPPFPTRDSGERRFPLPILRQYETSDDRSRCSTQPGWANVVGERRHVLCPVQRTQGGEPTPRNRHGSVAATASASPERLCYGRSADDT